MRTPRRFSFRFSSFAALAALLFAALWPQAAQAQQAGYVNQQAILAQMPEMQQAQQQLQQAIQSERKQLQQQQQQLQQQMQKFQQQGQMMSEQSRQQRRQELQQQQQELQQSMQQRDQQIAQRRRELMQPVFEKFQNALNVVASEQNLDFVVRDQALLYVSDTGMVNITEDVAARLGGCCWSSTPRRAATSSVIFTMPVSLT